MSTRGSTIPLKTIKKAASWKRNKKNLNAEREQLKVISMECREPLADMYLEHCEELFCVFQEPLIGLHALEYENNRLGLIESFVCEGAKSQNEAMY
ncbi:hypothetical protein ACFTQ7_04100 [Lysinibacillus sp. NPDC056959]|uniref:hypothetical protein n=1 Tax=Lysinibacillus sp. NPDC056959 TaxID=3345981 RepID=UPI003636C0CC